MLRRGYDPPFVPPLDGYADTANFDAEFTGEPPNKSTADSARDLDSPTPDDDARSRSPGSLKGAPDDVFAGWEYAAPPPIATTPVEAQQAARASLRASRQHAPPERQCHVL